MMYFLLELLKNDLFVWFTIIGTVLYFLLTKNHGYWASRNVKFIRPLPFFGNSFSSTFSIEPSHKIQQEQYNYLKGQPYGGVWGFWKPKLLLLDPQIIEQIMIKDFSYFTDRDSASNANSSDPLSNHLVNKTGNDWKILRTKLTPVFSSGKLKTMIQQIMECSDACVEQIAQKIATGKPFEVREEMAGFTMDVIGSCAFGLNLNAINDPDSQFKKMGQVIFAPSRKTKLFRSLSMHFGFVLKWFRRSTLSAFGAFFINTVMGIVKYREENNFHRSDFIQLMMEVRKEEEKQLKDGTISKIVMDDNTITSNSFVFLLAGYETTATTLGYVFYELSTNPEIQEKVYKEVEGVFKKHNGEITWEALNEMKYVEMVITETLRKHPPVIALSRKSVKPYKIPNTDLELPKGFITIIPVYSIHHDPRYYPDPEKFEPERFSEENKHKLVKSTYLPFGDGPRICIGLRFARMEMKIAIAKLIMKYKLSLNSKTITPLQYSSKTLFLVPVGGLWVDFIPRNNQEK
ncbi:unnamed protein product [Nezara viridula]|uniref:Cytochrome P450 n=1 Tax=Nezara viridula TaxID=85310 RepID=A0A9P0EH79_NEZVI|nr:unnamed protein product [Nezara viridula]